jgi:hypothetical protein
VAELTFVDDDGQRVVLSAGEADELLAATKGLEDATVSACPHCRSRVLAVVALTDLIDSAPLHPRSTELFELADDAPTLHLYLVDGEGECDHRAWRDPGFEEWLGAVSPAGPVPRHP